jgi:hypothetical protein
MTNIFLKDADLLTSPPIFGYKILKYMRQKKIDKISIFDIAEHFKDERWFSSKNMYFAIIFLFSLDIIDFQQIYIIRLPK